jgi:hypothetical protein
MRGALGDDALAQSCAEGRTLTPESAIEQALAWLSASRPRSGVAPIPSTPDPR